MKIKNTLWCRTSHSTTTPYFLSSFIQQKTCFVDSYRQIYLFHNFTLIKINGIEHIRLFLSFFSSYYGGNPYVFIALSWNISPLEYTKHIGPNSLLISLNSLLSHLSCDKSSFKIFFSLIALCHLLQGYFFFRWNQFFSYSVNFSFIKSLVPFTSLILLCNLTFLLFSNFRNFRCDRWQIQRNLHQQFIQILSNSWFGNPCTSFTF